MRRYKQDIQQETKFPLENKFKISSIESMQFSHCNRITALEDSVDILKTLLLENKNLDTQTYKLTEELNDDNYKLKLENTNLHNIVNELIPKLNESSVEVENLKSKLEESRKEIEDLKLKLRKSELEVEYLEDRLHKYERNVKN